MARMTLKTDERGFSLPETWSFWASWASWH